MAGPQPDTFDPNAPPGRSSGSGSANEQAAATAAAKKKLQPIAVPYGYTAPGTAFSEAPIMGDQGQLVHTGNYAPSTTQVPPRYHEGDEFLPASLSPQSIAIMQREMIAAGLLNPKGVLIGRYDGMTMAAYKKLLGYANASGQDMGTTLKNFMTIQQQVDKTGGQQVLGIQLTNDADLQNVFRNTAVNLTGHALKPDEAASMVQAYHAIQTWTQTQAAQLQAEQAAGRQGIATPDSGQTVTQTSAPNPQSYADQQIRQQHPGDVMENQLIGNGGLMDSFSNLLGQWNKS